jgi:hypothetical protein
MKNVVAVWIAFCILVISIMVLFCSDADAYTHDGDINPQHFFTYQPLLVEQLSEVTALMVVGNENSSPRFAVLCVMRVQGGLIILAYAYYDENGDFRHFMIEGNHYAETPFDRTNEAEAQLEQRLKKYLNKFRKVSNV